MKTEWQNIKLSYKDNMEKFQVFVNFDKINADVAETLSLETAWNAILPKTQV